MNRQSAAFFDLRALILGSGLVTAGALLAPLASTFQSAFGTASVPEYTGSSRDYVRVEKDAAGDAAALQTSIVRLVPRSGDTELLVDLVSAVHVGDPSYYKTLDRQLEQYDAVLYELVAPEGAQLPPSRSRDFAPNDPLSFLMAAGKRLFGFHGQLESMDYNRPNFVHADLSPKEMMQAWEARGENGLTIALSAAAEILRAANIQTQNAQQNPQISSFAGAHEFDLLGFITKPDAPVRFKKMLALQLDNHDVTAGLGRTLSTILIDDRNKEVVRVLNEQIAQGKKRIAIFYGAAHMPDLEKRVTDLFKMKRATWHWLTAWDLREPEAVVQPLLSI